MELSSIGGYCKSSVTGRVVEFFFDGGPGGQPSDIIMTVGLNGWMSLFSM